MLPNSPPLFGAIYAPQLRPFLKPHCKPTIIEYVNPSNSKTLGTLFVSDSGRNDLKTYSQILSDCLTAPQQAEANMDNWMEQSTVIERVEDIHPEDLKPIGMA